MYSTEINGENTEFGTSGMLYRSNKLMYDRATETLWHQFRGEPVVGPLAGSGVRLEILPNVLTTWGEWLAQHPDTTVISNDTGVYPADFYRSEWDMESIYFPYRADPGTMFPVADIHDGLPIKEQVFGLVFGGTARAYPRPVLAQVPVLNDTVGGQEVVIITVEGGGVRAYDRRAGMTSKIRLGAWSGCQVAFYPGCRPGVASLRRRFGKRRRSGSASGPAAVTRWRIPRPTPDAAACGHPHPNCGLSRDAGCSPHSSAGGTLEAVPLVRTAGNQAGQQIPALAQWHHGPLLP